MQTGIVGNYDTMFPNMHPGSPVTLWIASMNASSTSTRTFLSHLSVIGKGKIWKKNIHTTCKYTYTCTYRLRTKSMSHFSCTRLTKNPWQTCWTWPPNKFILAGFSLLQHSMDWFKWSHTQEPMFFSSEFQSFLTCFPTLSLEHPVEDILHQGIGGLSHEIRV